LASLPRKVEGFIPSAAAAAVLFPLTRMEGVTIINTEI